MRRSTSRASRRRRDGRGRARRAARRPAGLDQAHRPDQGQGAASTPAPTALPEPAPSASSAARQRSAATRRAVASGCGARRRRRLLTPAGPAGAHATPAAARTEPTEAPTRCRLAARGRGRSPRSDRGRDQGQGVRGPAAGPGANRPDRFDARQRRARSARASPTLDRLAEAAKTCPGMHIEVGGHASSRGQRDRSISSSRSSARDPW